MKKTFLFLAALLCLTQVQAQITASPTEICAGESTNIVTTGSAIGLNYALRNSSNVTVAGPIAGTGNSLSFNTGALNSSETFHVYRTGPGTSLNFDGNSQYVQCGAHTRGITTQVTVTAWIKQSATGTLQFIAQKYNLNGFDLLINTNGKAEIVGRDGGAYKTSGPSTTTVNDNQWHYIAGTINATTGVWSVYVDGVLESSANNTIEATPSLANAEQLRIGRYATYFIGSIDNVTIWNTALTAGEVLSNMTACLVGTETNLVGNFTFDEGTGTAVNDLSPTNVDGVLVNMDPSTDWVAPGMTNCTIGVELTPTVAITVTTISDEALTAPSTICIGASATVSTGNSAVGMTYYLRDDANDAIVDGPIAGTGSGIAFNTGAINASTTFNLYAKTTGKALNFNGINGYVTTGTLSGGRNIGQNVSAAAWIKTTATTPQVIVQKYNSNGFALYVDGTGKAKIDGRDGSFGYKTSGLSTTSVNDGEWHYVVGTINSLTGVWSIYVDGVFENSTTNIAGANPFLANNEPVIFGQVFSTNYFNGAMNNVTIWNTTLTASDVLNNMSICLTGMETGVVGNFRFNDGSGVFVNDNSIYAAVGDGSFANLFPSDWITGGNIPGCPTCEMEMTQKVTITPVTVDNGTTLNGTTLMANEAGATYQWLDCNLGNAPLIGETNQSFTPLANGDYAVEITVNGCTVTSNCANVTGVGVQNIIKSNNINIYPNPAKDFLNIVTTEKLEQATIYNVNGAVIRTVRTNLSAISVAELPQGMYILEVQSEKGISQNRFVKE